jgi:hypothetical protein
MIVGWGMDSGYNGVHHALLSIEKSNVSAVVIMGISQAWQKVNFRRNAPWEGRVYNQLFCLDNIMRFFASNAFLRACSMSNRQSEKSAGRGQISLALQRQYRDIDQKAGEIGTAQVILQLSIRY